MSGLTIPEEAIERACVAMNDGVWTAHHRERWGAEVELILGAAAPLIVAAELERIAESINYDRFRSQTSTGLVTSVDLVREEILARVSVLRGEGDRNA